MIYTKEMQIGKRKRPKQKDRTKITKKEYDKAVEVFGSTCFCGNPYNNEMHHIIYRSKSGRGTWRNLILLCKEHHTQAHTDYDFRKNLEIQRKRLFGQNFHMDKYDLYENGLIEEPTEKEMEAYFEKVVREKSK